MPDPTQNIRCPKCGSTNVECVEKPHHNHLCHDCGHSLLGSDYPVAIDPWCKEQTDACTHPNRAFTIGGPEDSDGYVWCPDCRTALHPDDDPHYPEHQWVWVDGNNVDAVVIYREWQRYQRASAEQWEADSNTGADDV